MTWIAFFACLFIGSTFTFLLFAILSINKDDD